MPVDEKIKELGFELIEQNDEFGYLKYENEEEEHCVVIYFSDSQYFIGSHTTYGGEYNEPVAMTYDECKAFLDKIDEMKSVWVY